MIFINDRLSIPENELTFAASRSGGPGGQNVNKVSSRVTLTFDVVRSRLLSEEQRTLIRSRLATRINKDGVLRVVSQRSRSQDLNREDAVQRFAEILRRALEVPVERVETKIPRAAHEQRMQQKKKRTVIKRSRSAKDWDGS